MKTLIRILTDFIRDDGMMLAAALSCFFLLAFIPFLLFLVSIFGYFLGSHREFHDLVLGQLMGFFPSVTREITEELASIITHREIGVITLTVYALFSYQLYSSLETAMNAIFKEGGKRSPLVSLALSLFTVSLLIASSSISFGLTSAVSALDHLQGLIPGLQIGHISAFLTRFLLPAFLVFLVASALYVILPKTPVKFCHALWGGIFAALFLEAAKHLFAFYVVVKLSRLGAIYGSLTAVVTFVMWLFYSSCIFLLGAELVHKLTLTRRR
jgi:membrane protein